MRSAKSVRYMRHCGSRCQNFPNSIGRNASNQFRRTHLRTIAGKSNRPLPYISYDGKNTIRSQRSRCRTFLRRAGHGSNFYGLNGERSLVSNCRRCSGCICFSANFKSDGSLSKPESGNKLTHKSTLRCERYDGNTGSAPGICNFIAFGC